IFDAGALSGWGSLSWTSDVPTGTGLTLSVRTGNTAIPDGTWTGFSTISASGGSIGRASRYIQYAAQLTTTDRTKTPVLSDVTIGQNAAVTPTISWSTPADITYGTAL